MSLHILIQRSSFFWVLSLKISSSRTPPRPSSRPRPRRKTLLFLLLPSWRSRCPILRRLKLTWKYTQILLKLFVPLLLCFRSEHSGTTDNLSSLILSIVLSIRIFKPQIAHFLLRVPSRNVLLLATGARPGFLLEIDLHYSEYIKLFFLIMHFNLFITFIKNSFIFYNLAYFIIYFRYQLF